jgi:hypothetical protein
MKTVTVRLLSLLALAAAMGLGQTQEQDVKGWSTAKWGMSLQQIREAFPSAGVVKPAKEDYTAFGRLKSHVMLATLHASAWFEFPADQDKLCAVNLDVDNARANRPQAFETLKSELTEQYGKPATSQSVSDGNASGSGAVTKSVVWRLTSTTITLTWSDYGDVGFVSVRYAERRPDSTF